MAQWRGFLVVKDLVQLAPGEEGCDALLPGEVGQVLHDARCGSHPFQVKGPRGLVADFRAESLIPSNRDCSALVCSKGHLLCQYLGGRTRKSAKQPARCQKCHGRMGWMDLRLTCETLQCGGYSVCAHCFSEPLQSKTIKHVPLMQQVTKALDPMKCLDFPTLTDICEVAFEQPAETEGAIGVLVATLGDQSLKPGDMRNITQDYLKVLTIINEMMYDNRVVNILLRAPGLQLALHRLRDYRDGGTGDPTDENIRMLANEIEKAVFCISGRPKQPLPQLEKTAFCPHGHPLCWKGSLTGFHLHSRSCYVCQKTLSRDMERYSCPVCRRHDVCMPCIMRGAS